MGQQTAEPQPEPGPEHGARPPWWPGFAMVGAVMALVLLAMAALGNRFAILGVELAVVLSLGALVLAVVSGLTGAAGVLVSLVRRSVAPVRGQLLLAMALALVVAVPMVAVVRQAVLMPPIHDVSTNLADPPEFLALLELRPSGSNSLDWDPTLVAEIAKTWPELDTLLLPGLSPDQALRLAVRVAEDLGWQVLATDAAGGRLEAAASSRWFGYVDDVVIRVRPGPAGGSQVDMRSASRVGQSDLGANASRIQRFQAAMVAR